MTVNLIDHKYRTEKVCLKCKEPLSLSDRVCSNGICPYCGADSCQKLLNYKVQVFVWVKYWWIFGHWEIKGE